MAVAPQVPAELTLTTIGGSSATAAQWVTTFHLALVAIDPYTNESSWLLETAARILTTFRGADCRTGWLVTADADDARAFLGPWADELLTFVDPDRIAVKALGLERLPALVHVRQDLAVVGVAEGWHPAEWEAVTDNLGRIMSWSRPVLPAAGDPTPFAGSPALG
ncbi:MAG: hypothetical protein HYX34_14795 [Actinobacteria bacterium]|nr:hypothetical protein [Actinomycetota bacterium]